MSVRTFLFHAIASALAGFIAPSENTINKKITASGNLVPKVSAEKIILAKVISLPAPTKKVFLHNS